MQHDFNAGAKMGASQLTYAIWFFGSFAATVGAPFGTHDIGSFWTRWAYWAVVVVASGLCATLLRRGTRRLFDSDGTIWADVALVVLMTMIFSPFLWLFTQVALSATQPTLPTILDMAKYVSVVSLVVCAVRRLTLGPETDRRPNIGTANAPLAQEPRLVRRLPSSFDGVILRLNVCDHHVKVVTTEGEFSIRLRFGDAVEEMDPVDGFCTHRSHWVAKQAVAGCERENSKTYVRLINGDRVPVSRTYQSELEAEGVLQCAAGA